MSLITRCPACQTNFRVVPDQLRISQGWVRCGQCQHIFDANAALINGAKLGNNNGAADGVINDVRGPQPNLPAAHERPGFTEPPVDGSASTQPVDLSLAFGAVDETAAPTADTLPVDIPLGAQPSGVQAGPPALPPVLAHESLVAAARQDVSFMRSMPEKPSWQRTTLRVVLGLFALALLVGLGLQAAVHERERIAAMFPQAKPALLWVCQHAKCSFSGLRQIESVVIDSSSLNKVRGDAYRLSLVLRNTSALELAMPALELTLTDSQDQAVMRRVLLANEYSPNSMLGASVDWSGAVNIAVRGGGSTERFSGYRVLAFYP